MLALTHLVVGLAVAHLTLLVFFLLGSAAFPWCDAADAARPSRVMMRVACTCALGMSIAGIALFILGAVGWLTEAGVVVTIVLAFAAACVAGRRSPFRASFWRFRARALTHCWSWQLALVYVALIVISTRAVIPRGPATRM